MHCVIKNDESCASRMLTISDAFFIHHFLLQYIAVCWQRQIGYSRKVKSLTFTFLSAQENDFIAYWLLAQQIL